MQPRVYHRLQQLETERARMRKLGQWGDQKSDFEQARHKVLLFLRIRGVEQTESESMFDAFARALGVGNRELRADMLAGIDPIKRWFAENGIYEEIERRKATGTWPAALGDELQNVRL